jgi:hypothetical protein
LELGLVVQRLQIRLALELVPPLRTPALVEGLAQGRRRVNPFSLQRADLYIGELMATVAKRGLLWICWRLRSRSKSARWRSSVQDRMDARSMAAR